MDPIRPELHEIMNHVGRILGDTFKSHGNYGFALLVFDFGDPPGFMNYISNAERTDVIKALREFIDKLSLEKSG